MDAPAITSAGKVCKLCKARGTRCHLHGGSPSPKSGKSSPRSGKSSPKSPKRSPVRKLSPNTKVYSNLDDLFGTFSSSPRKTTPAEFHYFEKLPMPALQEVLLNMEWAELRRVCGSVPRTFKICKSDRFRELYSKKHPVKPLFRGLKFKNFNHSRGVTTSSYVDSAGTEVIVDYFKFEGDYEVTLGILFKTEKGVFDCSISIESQGELSFSFGGPFGITNESEFFNAIGKPEWIGKRKNKAEWQAILKSIVQDIKRSLGSAEPVGTGGVKILNHLLQ
jgi:hypothetical protein